MDLKLLVEELKPHGLELAEDAAKKVLETTLDWLVAEVVKTENKVDDILVAVVPVLKPVLMDLVDKIHEEEK